MRLCLLRKLCSAVACTRMMRSLTTWQPDGDVSYCGLRVAAPRSEAEKNQLSIWSEMSPDMDYYFIAGKNMDEVISGYRTLTGKAPVYPKWVLGFWQSRERISSQRVAMSPDQVAVL